MTHEQTQAALALEMIAAVAAKLAADLRAGRLFPGDLTRRAQGIHDCLDDLKGADHGR